MERSVFVTMANSVSLKISIMRFLVLGVAVITVALSALPLAYAARSYGNHNGYLQTIDGERDRNVEDMIVIQPPKVTGPTLRDRIFNDKLSKEFSDQYEEKFGRTEVERVYNSPNRYTYYDDVYGFKGTPQEASEERRKFADFMVRRLTEYHVDQFAQTNPRAKVVWEAKERLSQMKVEVKKVRFNMNYQIAGNTFDMKVDNPWLETSRIRLQMNPSAIGPGPIDEATFSIGRPVTNKLALEAHYKLMDGVISYIARRSITPQLGSTMTVSTFTRKDGITKRESVYLSGLSYVF